MELLSIFFRKTFAISIILVLSGVHTVPVVFANETIPPNPDTSVQTTTEEPQPVSNPPVSEQSAPTEPIPQPKVQGPTQPTGAEGTAYTYNAATGNWESEHYVWDPVTKQTQPKVAPSYSYNPDTGMWDTTEWIYNAVSGTYQPNVTSTPAPISSPSSQAEPFSTQNSSAQPSLGLQTSPYESSHQPAGVFDLFYNNTISNSVASFSKSGDAWVSGNTVGGNALSGDALAMATIFNLLQSSAGFNPGNFTSFISNVYGDVQGDMMIDPSQLSKGSSDGPYGPSGNIKITSSQNNLIENTIVLDAQSGDVGVTNNTQAGNATSGNADAVANVVNMINSIIANNQSFVGMINIYGNLDGDILLPPEQLTKLLASSSGIPTVTLSTPVNTERNVDVTFNDNQSISNTITTTASTGDAAVHHNTAAGNATTGEALTNVTLLNLTGREIIGSNSLLVFVNVLGTWVGLIMDAPAGTTSAAIGGQISNDGMWMPDASSVDATYDTNSTIRNNLHLNAQSGDASVANNTQAGDATTGDATASANVLNIINSRFVLSDWFGILFINVFGSWHGSFGIDTASGNSPKPQENPSNDPTPKVFKFSSEQSNSGKPVYRLGAPVYYGTNNIPTDQQDSKQNATLASAKAGAINGLGAGNEQNSSTPSGVSSWLLLSIASVVIGLGILGGERLIVSRRNM